jgi:hypothetical protein
MQDSALKKIILNVGITLNINRTEQLPGTGFLRGMKEHCRYWFKDVQNYYLYQSAKRTPGSGSESDRWSGSNDTNEKFTVFLQEN